VGGGGWVGGGGGGGGGGVPCYETPSTEALLPGRHILPAYSREAMSARSGAPAQCLGAGASGEVFDHLSFSRCVYQVHTLSLHIKLSIVGGHIETELPISSWTARGRGVYA
jgi:hypothetical protein